MSGQAGASRATHVELRNVSKSFGGTQALDSVSLSIAAGSVHALVGENGAGKSTLGKIVSGVLAPDRGSLLVDGTTVSFRSPRDALAHGIAVVAQEPTIVPGRTVEENVFLGFEPTVVGFVRRRALRKRFLDLTRSAGFDLPPGRPAGALRTGEQQGVEILAALVRNARLIVMDEPSAALTVEETTKLHELIRSLIRGGTTVLLVSHFLREVLELADTVTVLRDGRLVRTSSADQETESSLVEAMLGRSLEAQFPAKRRPAVDAPVVLQVRDLHAPGVSDASFDVRAGEIVGLAGLVGAGRSELARTIFGAQRTDSGAVELPGGRRVRGGPRAALRSGVVMIPESRADDGFVPARSVTENVSLPSLRRLSRLGVVRRRYERRETGRVLDRVDVRGNRTGPVLALSGGNQQKALFARSLLSRPTLLIADEPTRGVDVGAKRAIYELIVELADEGLGVVLISSEIEEILGLAHRVLVMRGGRLVAELDEETMSEASVLSAAFATATTPAPGA
jgi:rhamnose transport system ATP-binding protein